MVEWLNLVKVQSSSLVETIVSIELKPDALNRRILVACLSWTLSRIASVGVSILDNPCQCLHKQNDRVSDACGVV